MRIITANGNAHQRTNSRLRLAEPGAAFLGDGDEERGAATRTPMQSPSHQVSRRRRSRPKAACRRGRGRRRLKEGHNHADQGRAAKMAISRRRSKEG